MKRWVFLLMVLLCSGWAEAQGAVPPSPGSPSSDPASPLVLSRAESPPQLGSGPGSPEMYPSRPDAEKWGTVLQEAKEKGITLLPPEVLAMFRTFLLACTRASVQPPLDLDRLIQIIPVETLYALDDVWPAWLDFIDPRCLVGQHRVIGGTSVDTYLFDAACEALERTFNPAALPRLLQIIHEAPARSIYPAFPYLNAMGAEEAYEDILRAAQAEDRCDNRFTGLLFVAGESRAVPLFDALQCPGPGANGLPGRMVQRIRPDLMRGLAPSLVRDPERRVLWTPIIPRMNPSFKRVFEYGSAPLTDEELLHEAVLAEEGDEEGLKGLWINLLSLRDSTVGTEELIQWALIPKKGEYELNAVRYQAARGLLRRLLGPRREALLDRMRGLDPAQRAALVDEILADSGKFPGFAPQNALTCRVGPDPEIRKANLNEMGSRPFLLQHQEQLFSWIEWTSHPERLTAVYAQMTHEKARQHFNALLQDQDPQAIQLAWSYSLPVPSEIIHHLGMRPGLGEEPRVYALLLKAERGEEPAYKVLVEMIMRWAEHPEVYSSRYVGAILAEIERRGDWIQLVHVLEKMKPANLSPPLLIPGIGNEGSQQTRFLALLLRGAPSRARLFLTSLDPDRPDSRRQLLEVAVQAESPHAEWILKIIQPFISAMAKQVQEWERSPERRMWAEALRRTGTPWCRYVLASDSDWRSLALLGDRRSLYLWGKDSNGRYSLPPPGAALMFGEIRLAAERAVASSWNQKACGLFAPMQGSTPVPTDRWPPGNLKRVSDRLLAVFPELLRCERLVLLAAVAGNPELISKEFVEAVLKDEFGPVRLSLLLYLLEHPRGGFDATLRRIETQDPFPWCRRLAHEVRIFHPDPLEPERGIQFEFPK